MHGVICHFDLPPRVYADLLPFLFPKRKAVELSGQDATPLRAEIRFVKRVVVDPRA